MKALIQFFMIAASILLIVKRSAAQTNIFPSTGAVGIGTVSPDPSSLFEIVSTSKGILIPRMTKTQRDAISIPSTGLLIYQTNLTPGFYYYNGNGWVPISAKGANTALSNLAVTTSINQNLLPNTTSTLDLGSSLLKWRDIYSGSIKFSDGTQQTTASQWIANGSNIYFNGAVGIGVSSPAYKLDILGDINLANGNVLRIGGTPVVAVNTTLGNISVGQNALINNTTGYSDIAIGVNSLQFNSTQHNIVAIGDSALYNNGTGALSSTDAAANTAVGSKALYSNTTGRANSAFGLQSAYSNTSGIHNTSSGYQALYSNKTGNENTVSGYQALYSNIDGYSNIAIGVNALHNNTTGHNLVAVGDSALYNQSVNSSNFYMNTAIGSKALYSNTTGAHNTANGYQALYSNISGNSNTANGYWSLFKNTTGSYNTANGENALNRNISGSNNTATGYYALELNRTGSNNTAIGFDALISDTSGFANTAVGFEALFSNSNGYYNTAIGYDALAYNSTGILNMAGGYESLSSNTTGSDNTAYGDNSLTNNTTGSGNTAIGSSALNGNVTGGANTALGQFADVGSGNLSNATSIGFQSTCGSSNRVRIGNNAVTSIGGYTGWSNISDGRVKKNIKTNVPGLAFINRLQPVTYNLSLDAADKILQRPVIKDKDGKIIQPSANELTARNEKEQIVYTGFIAQDVEKSAKEIGYDFSGVDAAKNDHDLYGLRYAEFVVPLVKAVQELSAQNDSLKNIVQPVQKENQQLKISVNDLQKQLNDVKNTIAQIESAMSQCCSRFSSSINSSENTSSITKNSDQPKLEQNVPNPFDGSCYISYYIPSGVHNAQLRITDVRGHILKSYSVATSGYGKQTIYGNELSSGMYQYSLLIDGKLIDTKKMILAK